MWLVVLLGLWCVAVGGESSTLFKAAVPELLAREPLVDAAADGDGVLFSGFQATTEGVEAEDTTVLRATAGDVLAEADGHTVLSGSLQATLEALASGAVDVAVMPILDGEKLAGFVKVEFFEPSTVSVRTQRDLSGIKAARAAAEAKRQEIAEQVALGLIGEEYEASFYRQGYGIVFGTGTPVVVSGVVPNSAAFERGVKAKDTVIAVNGADVESLSSVEVAAEIERSEFPLQFKFRRPPRPKVDPNSLQPNGSLVVVEPPMFAGIVLPYDRGLFGPPLGCDQFELKLLSPPAGCAAVSFQDGSAADRNEDALPVAGMVHRGKCPFYNKALAVQAVGGAMVVINSHGKPRLRMPAARGEPVTVPSVLVDHTAGQRLETLLDVVGESSGALRAAVMKASDVCLQGESPRQLYPAFPPLKRRLSKTEAPGAGHLFLQVPGKELVSFPFRGAHFGLSVLLDDLPIRHMMLTDPPDACVPDGVRLKNSRKLLGLVAMAYRGKCMFPEKALAAQAAGAIALVIVNMDDNIARMHAPPDFDASKLRIPLVLTTPNIKASMPQFQGDKFPRVRFLMLDPDNLPEMPKPKPRK